MLSFSHCISSSTMDDIQISNFLKRAEENVVLILKTISRYSVFHIYYNHVIYCLDLSIKNVNQELK